MQVHALLENRRAEIVLEIEKLRNELAEIDRMMQTARPVSHVPSPAPPQVMQAYQPQGGVQTLTVPATKDEAILTAISAGNKTPAAISDFIRERLGMPVNPASTRTRLSRMKAAQKIDHDGNGWKLKSGE